MCFKAIQQKFRSKVRRPAPAEARGPQADISPPEPVPGGSSTRTSPPATSEEDAALQLWNSAYEEIRQKNEQLTEAYERILTLNINHGVDALTAAAANIFANGAAEARIQRMARSVQKSLEKIHARRSTREGVIQASGLLAKLEKVGKLALTPAPPPATMVWSGICAAVQILSGPFEAEQSMIDGLEHVIDRMDWYVGLSRIIFEDVGQGHQRLVQLNSSLESQVAKIYRAILTYEMTAVLYCYKDHRIFTYAKVIWGSYDWTIQRSKLAKLEERLDGDMAHYSSRESVAALRSLLREASASSGLLREMASEVQHLSSIQQARQDQQTQRDTEERTRRRDLLIGRFKRIPYEERMRINPLRVANTCEWFCRHPQFLNWLEDSDGLLVVSADPGCGKSVLSRYLIEEYLPASDKTAQARICYFFFKDMPEQRSAATAICSLLHCLFVREPLLADHCESLINQAGSNLTSHLASLWDVLEQALRHSSCPPVVCVLDALDDLRNVDQGHIHLDGDGKTEKDLIQKEIQLVVEYRLSQLAEKKRLDDTKRQILKDGFALKGGEDRTYLWASLVFESLEKNNNNTQNGWRDLVSNLPQTVEDAYARLLQQVSNVDAEKVKRLFHLMVAARRPLKLKEMDIALCAWENVQHERVARSEDGLDLNSAFSDWVRQACGLFVTIYDNRLFFIHQTAKEFLLNEGGEPDVVRESDRPTASWHRRITLTAAHRVMAESCIAYLSMDCFRSVQFRNELIVMEFMKDIIYPKDIFRWRDVRSVPVTFCDYAISFWTHHFDFAQIVSHDGIQDISDGFQSSYLSLFGQDNPLSSPWSICAALHCEGVSLSETNLRPTIELVKGEEHRCIEGLTPLGLRAALGHFGAVHAILEETCISTSMLPYEGSDDLALRRENGKQVSHRPRSLPHQPNSTRLPYLAHQPIFFAVTQPHCSCLKYILATWRQSQLGALAPDGTPLLLFAAKHGFYQAVTLLLQHGFDYTIQDQHGHNLVDAFRASLGASPKLNYIGMDPESCEEALRLLLAVSQASQWKPDWSCLLRFVAWFLEPGLPMLNERLGRLALAMKRGRPEALKTFRESQTFTRAYKESLVKALVDRGASVRAVDECGRSALHLACRNGGFWTFMFLLENNPIVSKVDRSGQSALHHLCQRLFSVGEDEFSVMATVLVQCGVDINLADVDGMTALYFLLDNLPQAVCVESLLNNGASVQVKTHNGRSAFHFLRQKAAPSEVVELLLKYGADIEALDDQDNTPLMSLLSDESEGIHEGQALLFKGANLHARNKAGETPLGRLRYLRSAFDVGGELAKVWPATECLSLVVQMLAWADSQNTMNE
ncbi:ankyrin repeat protein [Verticillium dahliae VdLs.17]|uniref:Ankyrin repeat protein n=1 Tax=Verticillium dahliae (strain VdLs.17 / ATCC MYA-4575 / FGSC 10137) TaxID=498257 RepID=G2WUJ6_VERDV|nr:ankyrin repeat protein [Verticillium dahliae VdLs.17]EGY17787.1 ankyrin repeat protein [Verticillium dahliae VdLs.17]